MSLTSLFFSQPAPIIQPAPAVEYTHTQGTCPHDDWTIRGPEQWSWGTCTKCGAELPLDELLVNWKARLECDIEERLSKAGA